MTSMQLRYYDVFWARMRSSVCFLAYQGTPHSPHYQLCCNEHSVCYPRIMKSRCLTADSKTARPEPELHLIKSLRLAMQACVAESISSTKLKQELRRCA